MRSSRNGSGVEGHFKGQRDLSRLLYDQGISGALKMTQVTKCAIKCGDDCIALRGRTSGAVFQEVEIGSFKCWALVV